MRGFVVLFDTQPEVPRTQDDSLEQRFAQWEAGFAATRVQRLDHPNCRFYLFTASDAVPAEFNQRVWRTPTELLLWTGPRVDMTAADLLQPPISHDLTELAAATLASPGALDTAVCVSYRAAAHSLIVKTDVLNATFVYWARSGRWLLLSNSSLTLARLIRAGVDWVAAWNFSRAARSTRITVSTKAFGPSNLQPCMRSRTAVPQRATNTGVSIRCRSTRSRRGKPVIASLKNSIETSMRSTRQARLSFSTSRADTIRGPTSASRCAA